MALAGTLLLTGCGGASTAKRDSARLDLAVSDGAAPTQAQAASKEAGAALVGQASTNSAPAPAADRKIITNVFLDLSVKDVQSSFERISLIAESSGGLVADANLRTEFNQRRASVTVRVPAARVQDVLAQMRGLAVKVDSERVNANDVTEEYTDVQARLRNLEATEQQLLVFLGQAKNTQDLLQVQDRLTTTRAEIERLKGRVNLLTRLSDLATIQAQLHVEAAVIAPERPSNPLDALRLGWSASLEVIGGLALALLTVAAFSWWLLPFAALAAWFARRGLQRRRRTA